MSRGLGKMQKAVLEVLSPTEYNLDTLAIAGRVHRHLHGDSEVEPLIISVAFYESVRRALKSLERKGMVCGGRGRLRWGGKPWWLQERAS